jgi:hypothetical protein
VVEDAGSVDQAVGHGEGGGEIGVELDDDFAFVGAPAEKKTRDRGVRVLLHAESLAPQRIRHDVFIREVVAGLLRQAWDEAGGRELRRLAWRLGIAPMG